MRFSRIFKNGNSKAICISKEEAKEIGVDYGDFLKVTVENGKIIIEKA